MSLTWTYVGPTTDKDKVRFLIGDTNTNDKLLYDEEINYLLTTYSDVRLSAVEACLAIATKFGNAAQDKRVGDLRIMYLDRSKSYRELADRLRQSANRFVYPYCGGISEADEQTVNSDGDRENPSFYKGLMKRKLPDVIPDGDEDD